MQIKIIHTTMLWMVISCNAQAKEYVYPVAANDQYVYFMHQISLKQLQILQWDRASKIIAPAVQSTVAPAGFRLLPNGTGYSFIDQGQLYVKRFAARSAQRIDMAEPLHTIETIQWIDGNTCYFSAKRNDLSTIYHLSLNDGALRLVHASTNADCLYPQKLGNSLYYIKRTSNRKYSIEHSRYDGGVFNDSVTVLENGSEPIAFLHMEHHGLGYYISFPLVFAQNSVKKSVLSFGYHQLVFDATAQRYVQTKLFDFYIPLDLLMPDSKERLYESIAPLLPRITKTGIYYCSAQESSRKTSNVIYRNAGYENRDFCDCERHVAMQGPLYRNLGGGWHDAGCIAIYCYDFATQTIALQAQSPHQDLLSPLALEGAILYGYSLMGSSKKQPLIQGMKRSQNGLVEYEPSIVLLR